MSCKIGEKYALCILRGYKAFVYAAVTVFAACLVSCTDAYSGKNMPEGEYSEAALLKALEEDSTDTDALSKLWGIYTREGRFHDLIQSAGRCYRIAMEERDTALMVVSGVYLGQA